MAKAPIPERHYDATDSYMLQRVTTILAAFGDDLADFTAFAASFDSAFKTQWQTDLDAAMAVLDDETVVDQQKALSEAVVNAMTNARNKWSELKFFVKQAFPSSTGRQDEFGANDYDKVRASQIGMIRFMEKAHTTAEKYKTSLIAKAYTQEKIDEIATLGAALAAADSAQEGFKGSRRVQTEERNALMNKVYDTMLVVNEAAQIIYADSAAKRKTYSFQPIGDTIDGPGFYPGTAGAGTAAEVAHINYRADRELSFQNTGDGILQFYLSGGGLSPQGEIVNVNAGATETRTMAAMDATGNHIIVNNPGESACTFVVTVGA